MAIFLSLSSEQRPLRCLLIFSATLCGAALLTVGRTSHPPHRGARTPSRRPARCLRHLGEIAGTFTGGCYARLLQTY